jgi:hypothetical protein
VLTLPDSEIPSNPISPLRQKMAYILVAIGGILTSVGVGLVFLPAGIIAAGILSLGVGYILGAE